MNGGPEGGGGGGLLFNCVVISEKHNTCVFDIQELREDNMTLLETKVLLEEQLASSRERCDKLHTLEKDNLLLQAKINDLEMVGTAAFWVLIMTFHLQMKKLQSETVSAGPVRSCFGSVTPLM